MTTSSSPEDLGFKGLPVVLAAESRLIDQHRREPSSRGNTTWSESTGFVSLIGDSTASIIHSPQNPQAAQSRLRAWLRREN
jgi:hypothetical protein